LHRNVIGSVALHHQAVAETEHLADHTAVLVAVRDDDGVDALIDALDGEPRVGR
jgi:hypothetical protein